MAEYYVVRDKNTGLYFRGKGVNRWGKYYNQASVYRIKANAQNAVKEVAWRGEQAEIVPIQIFETTADVVPRSEGGAECPVCHGTGEIGTSDWLTKHVSKEQLAKKKAEAVAEYDRQLKAEVTREIFEEIEELLKRTCKKGYCGSISDLFAELKKKYTESEK